MSIFVISFVFNGVIWMVTTRTKDDEVANHKDQWHDKSQNYDQTYITHMNQKI